MRTQTLESGKSRRGIMDTLRRSYHGSKGGGGGGGPRLERRNATKNIAYDSRKQNCKRSPDSDQSSHDESESSNHSREDLSLLDEYRVMGKDSVEEMNQVCRYLGLPGPDSLGITREDWNANKPPTSGVVAGLDSVSSVIQEDPSDFTFVVSPPPSYLATSPRDSYRGPMERVKDNALAQATGNDGVSKSQSTFRNHGDASDVGSVGEQHQEQEQERVQEYRSHRSPLGWRTRSTSLPITQSRTFSPPVSSLVLAGTPKPLLGHRIFEYPDPVTHIQRALSQPVPLPSEEEKVSRGSVLEINNISPMKSAVHEGKPGKEHSGDPVRVVTREDPMPGLVTRREGDSSSISSSCSDGSGDYSGREASRSPDQRSFEKKQDVGRAKVVAPSIPGQLRPPPSISVLNLPSSAFTTHDLLGGLGPPDNLVAVTGAQSSDSDSEDDDRLPEHTAIGEVGLEASGTDDESLEGSSDKPQDPIDEGHNDIPELVVAVTSADGNKAAGAKVAIGEEKDMWEDRLSEIEGNGERSSLSVDAREGATALSGQIMSLDLAQPPVPPREEVQDLRPEDDQQGVQTLTFPWSKGDLLGAGSFGTVYEAVDSNGSFFAVKEVSLIDTDRNSQQCISQLEQEIELLSRFKHENIVQYLGTEREDGKLYIFLELVSKGSLASLCKKFRLTHSQIIAYTRQILKGLKYLHDMNVVHRDIKCANILVDVKGTCKLADFGLAKQISALDQLKSCKGSAYWMAPEVIDPKKTYWLPADIWSLGCSVLEMFTGSPPFGDQEWYRVLWKVGHGEAPPIPEHLSDDAKDFIGQCLEVNPAKRPTATVLLQHKFVNSSSTPTSSGHLNPQLVVNSLHTITEERTGDFTTKSSGTYRSAVADSPLSNGHSGH